MQHITQTDLNGIPLVSGQTANQGLIWDGANWVNGLPNTGSTLSDVLGNGNTTGANNISINTGQRVVYNNSGFSANILEPTLGGNINITLPSATGTLALISDIPPTPDAWLGNGNTEGVLKYIGTNDNFDLPIYTNGAEVARFLTGGNFAVGLTSPTARAHFQGSGNTSTTYTAKFQNTSGSEILTVRDDSKVLIGAPTNQALMLNTLGGGMFAGSTSAPSTSGSSTSEVGLRIANTSFYGIGSSLDFGNNGSIYLWIQGRSATDYTVNNPIKINPNGGDVYLGDNFYYKYSAGITLGGTDDPAFNRIFSLKDSSNNAAATTVNAIIGSDVHATFKNINSADNTYIVLNFQNASGAGVGQLGFQNNTQASDTADFFIRTREGGGIYERLRLTYNGNLGLGVAAASISSRLHIQSSGSTSATYGLKVQNSSASDMFWVRDDGRIFISNASNVTIGTTTNDPAATFGIKAYNASSADSVFKIRNTTPQDIIDIKGNGDITLDAGRFVTGSFNVRINKGAGSNADLHITHGNATVTENLFIAEANSGAHTMRMRNDGYVVQAAVNSAFASGDLSNSEMCWYIDEAGNNIIVKVKYSTGTVKTATIGLL